ncbi:uncharacterized protein LOC141610796 isoform X2 [Silene latifolia]|uniref:uncharacterized protein LOC141610796 isoform X2 n=1 Tax=Silene latifolia TaxID=37657 RepID=UPI003D774922
MSKGLWMSKDAVSLTNGEMTFDNISRMQVKRPPQWFIDGSEAEPIPYKKQALEDACGSSFTGLLPSSVPTWGNLLGFNSVPTQLNERYVEPNTTRNINFDETIVPPVVTEHLITGRDPFGNISPFGLSMSHSPKNSMFAVDFGGIRKVKVSEVRDSENLMPNSEFVVGRMGHGYSKVDNASVSMALTYGQEDANIFTLGEPYSGKDDDFLSIRRSFNKGDGTELAIGHKNEADSSIMPISSSFSKSNIDVMSTPQSLYKQDSSNFSLENPRKADDSMISVSQEDKGDSFVSASNNYSYKIEVNTMGTAQSRNKSESRGVSVSYPLDTSESSIISFGGHHNEASTSGRLICNHGLPAGQAAEILDFSNLKDFAVANNPIVCTSQALSDGIESTSKRKGDRTSLKNASLNNFPANVRSLLSTGILDEVPVKYTAWSREILHGIIKGSGYLCGCQSCNFSKVINAFEFERHAGCKTKHPNNHIYFENGKTIYGVVQELRSTPQNMLFDVIQTVTGSPINQKSFRLWKESFLAATRELQRIYSKDERKQLL